MRLIVDTHTHTVASGHAYSTILENVKYAKKNGLKAISITDHTYGLPGGAHSWHFWNLRNIPDKIYGITVIKGAEANILNDKGELDIEEKFDDYSRLQLIIASIHDTFIKNNNCEYTTNAYINAIKNPHTHIIGHPDNYDYDIEAVVQAAKKYNKAFELNNSSFKTRATSKERVQKILKLCKENEVYISCGSDAHIALDVGNFKNIIPYLKESEFPEKLILNTSVKKLSDFLTCR